MRPPPKQSRALKIAEHGRSVRCCWGCCSDACADATARPADGRARAYSRFLHARGTIPSSAPARLYIRRMAEYGCFARCCRGRCSDACADTTARPADGRARACSAFCMTEVRFLCQRRHVCTYGEWQSAGVPPPVVGAAVPTLARTRPNGAGRRALPLRRIWSVFAAGDTALFCRGVGFPGRDVPKSIPLFRERSFGRRWQLSD